MWVPVTGQQIITGFMLLRREKIVMKSTKHFSMETAEMQGSHTLVPRACWHHSNISANFIFVYSVLLCLHSHLAWWTSKVNVVSSYVVPDIHLQRMCPETKQKFLLFFFSPLLSPPYFIANLKHTKYFIGQEESSIHIIFILLISVSFRTFPNNKGQFMSIQLIIYYVGLINLFKMNCYSIVGKVLFLCIF